MMRFWSMMLVCVVACFVVVGNARAQESKSGKAHKTPEERFKALDKDGDGFLTLEEYSADPHFKNLDKAKIEARFKKLDKDGDGKLSLEEFKAGAGHGKKAKKSDQAPAGDSSSSSSSAPATK
jgi:hypothetical protein